MNKYDAKKIINDEKLFRYNWFEDHSIEEEEVGIYLKNSEWVVYTSNERCTKESESFYILESEAITDFIDRLRASKRFSERYRR